MTMTVMKTAKNVLAAKNVLFTLDTDGIVHVTIATEATITARYLSYCTLKGMTLLMLKSSLCPSVQL
jgi:hypothetical protein